MPELTFTYYVLTTHGDDRGAPNTRIENVARVEVEDDWFTLYGTDGGVLFTSPTAKMVYAKRIGPLMQEVKSAGTVTTGTGGAINTPQPIDAKAIHQALLKFKRSEGINHLGLA